VSHFHSTLNERSPSQSRITSRPLETWDEEGTLKHSVGRFKNEDAGNIRDFSVQLPLRAADLVEQAALRKRQRAEDFLRDIIVEAVEEKETLPVEVHLQRLDELVKKMDLALKKSPMQEEKDAGKAVHSLEERAKKREHLIQLGMEAYDELRKIATSEQTSKESVSRIQAFSVMARIGTFNAAVIRDAENDELGSLLAEVEQTDAEFKEELKRLEKKRREEEAEERQRYH
jgi:hypothetical protein